MKVLLVLALLSGFLASCVPASHGLTWEIRKSDATGKCYDTAYSSSVFAIGAEVPCP